MNELTKKLTQAKIKTMQAYIEGRTIEVKDSTGQWKEAEEPKWDWISFDYRAKCQFKSCQTCAHWQANNFHHGICHYLATTTQPDFCCIAHKKED